MEGERRCLAEFLPRTRHKTPRISPQKAERREKKFISRLEIIILRLETIISRLEINIPRLEINIFRLEIKIPLA